MTEWGYRSQVILLIYVHTREFIVNFISSSGFNCTFGLIALDAIRKRRDTDNRRENVSYIKFKLHARRMGCCAKHLLHL